MIKEHSMGEKFDSSQRKFRKYKPPTRFSRLLEKGGLATDYGVRKIQDYMVMEGNNNLIFGSYKGTPIGVCHDNRYSNRNWNTFVLAGETDKGWKYHTLPNLLAMHSSAVIVEKPERYTGYLSELQKSGCNLFLVDFSNRAEAQVPKSHYNPFIHFWESKADKSNSCERHIMYLADTAASLFHKERDKQCAAHGYMLDSESLALSVWIDLLRTAFVYVGMSDNVKHPERNFKTVKAILHDIEKNGKGAVDKYLLPQTSSVKHVLDETDEEMFSAMLSALIDDLVPLTECNTFIEGSDTLNVNAQKLVEEQSYLFIPNSDLEVNNKRTGFLLAMLSKELYNYGECNWRYTNQALSRHFQFYLGEFENYKFPNFWFCLATCRKYGIGYSIISQGIPRIKKAYAEDNEWEGIIGNTDTTIGYALEEEEDVKFLQKYAEYRVDTNGKEIPEWKQIRERKRWEGKAVNFSLRYACGLTSEQLHTLFEKENRAFICIRCYAPILSDSLKTIG